MSSRFVWLAAICIVIAAVSSASADDPNQPVVDPNQPVVDPNQPAVDPNQPAVEPNEPAVDPNQPAVEPNEPAVEPNEPAVEPNEPVVEPNEPAVEPNEPAVEPNEPVVEPNEPAVEPNEPVVEPNEPAVEPNEPVVEPNEPVVDVNQPVLVAQDPRPVDGAINRRIDTPLSWTAGETAVSHDVYLGTSLEDVATGAESVFQGNQAETTFDPNGDLAFGTTYYWRVDEVDSDGKKATGDVWSFTTRLEGADMAFNESPVNGAEGRPDLPVLSWTAGVEAVEHAIYLGTDQAAVTAGNTNVFQVQTTDTFFVPAAPLNWNTTYYWRVDEIDADGYVAPGLVWSFKVADYVWIADGPLTLEYDNTVEPYTTVLIQEFAVPQDWTKNGVTSLQLEIKGQPEAVADVNDANEPVMVELDEPVVEPNQPVVEPNEPAVEPNEPAVEPNEAPVHVPPANNDPAPLFVMVTDSSGNAAVIPHPGNPDIVTSADWTMWKILVSRFSGVDLKNVVELTIAVGDETADGVGLVQISNVRVVKPIPLSVEAKFKLAAFASKQMLTDHVIVEGEAFQVDAEAYVNWGAVRDDKSNVKVSLYYEEEDGSRVSVASKSTSLPWTAKKFSTSFSTADVRKAVGHKLGVEFTNLRENRVSVQNVSLKMK